MTGMRRLACGPLLIVVLLSGCGAGTREPTAAVAPSAEPANPCEPQPAMVSKAIATPKLRSCDDRAALGAATEACNGGDASECYQVGVCFAVVVSALDDKDPVRRAAAVTQGKKAFRVACDGGIAEACDNRAGMIENQATSPAARKEACQDVIRACHLGKKVDCAECFGCGT